MFGQNTLMGWHESFLGVGGRSGGGGGVVKGERDDVVIRGAYHLHEKSNGTHHSIWSTSEIMGFWSK